MYVAENLIFFLNLIKLILARGNIYYLHVKQIDRFIDLTNFVNKSMEWLISAKFHVRPMGSSLKPCLRNLSMRKRYQVRFLLHKICNNYTRFAYN